MVVRFIMKSLLLTLLIAGISLSICFLPSETLFYTLLDKQQRLQTVPAPRLVFVGGSGLIYGLDSPCLESALGLPVVNAGLHGGLGLRFLLDQVRPNIKNNDIVVVIPEYGVLLRGYVYNAPTTALLAFTNPRLSIQTFSARDYLEALPGYPTIAYAKLVLRPVSMIQNARPPFIYATPDYWKQSFNLNGDFLVHLKSTPPAGAIPDVNAIRGSNIIDAVAMLNDFNHYATSQGAQVYLVLPPLIDTRYQQSIPALTHIYAQLQRDLRMPVLSSPTDYIYPISYFYDTPEHLNAIGRKARTEELIEDLRKIPSIAKLTTSSSSTCTQ